MQFRDRIRELRRVKASELKPNPRNWRTHPPRQKRALLAMLNDVGFANAILARETEEGQLQIIDGHLRADAAPDQETPVLVLDVTADEADKLLATLDPLASLAEANADNLQALLATIQVDDDDIRELFDSLNKAVAAAANDGAIDGARDEVHGACDNAPRHAPDNSPAALPNLFHILVQCDSEADQQAVYDQMTKEGYSCRVLTL